MKENGITSDLKLTVQAQIRENEKNINKQKI